MYRGYYIKNDEDGLYHLLVALNLNDTTEFLYGVLGGSVVDMLQENGVSFIMQERHSLSTLRPTIEPECPPLKN